MPFLFESACWWTSALYPFPSSPCEGRCFLHCDENLAALLRPVALGPIPPLFSEQLGCHSSPCRAWPHLTAIHRSVALGLISLVLTLLLLSLSQLPSPPSGSITVISIPSYRSVGWRGAEGDTQVRSLQNPPCRSVSVRNSYLSQSYNHSHRTFDLQRLCPASQRFSQCPTLPSWLAANNNSKGPAKGARAPCSQSRHSVVQHLFGALIVSCCLSTLHPSDTQRLPVTPCVF